MTSCAAAARTPSSTAPSVEDLALYMPLVRQVVARALRKLPPNVLRDDLLAAGMFGLVDALRRSADRGPSFDWYARIRIRGAVVDELRAQDWLTRRVRTRVARAQAQGRPAGIGVVGFDDLPDVQAHGFIDESAVTPHDEVEQRLDRAALKKAVAKLPEREGKIVAWHYFEGVPFKIIAKRLGVSEPRISQLHARAIGRLRVTMVENGAEAA
jgi:RNA polymerase sigma factor for flagellar operon FliA